MIYMGLWIFCWWNWRWIFHHTHRQCIAGLRHFKILTRSRI